MSDDDERDRALRQPDKRSPDYLRDYIERLVDDAPPLDEEQIATIRAVFRRIPSER